MGSGFESVAVHRTADHDLLVGKWADGRIGTVRGNRTGNHNFGGLLHTAKETRFVAVDSHPRPFYACLVEAIIGFFRTGIAPVSPDETMEILRFIDQANAQRCP